MSGDIPLATPQEIEAFVASCDVTRYDYFLGMTSAQVLRAYYPRMAVQASNGVFQPA